MLTRRGFFLLPLAVSAGLPGSAGAEEARLAAEIAVFAAGRPVENVVFGFETDPFAESGYTVPVSLRPFGLQDGDRITEIRILAAANPLVRVASFRFGPGATGAVATRIRLARSQIVTALARTAAGRVLREDRRVDVLVGGCGFDVETTPG